MRNFKDVKGLTLSEEREKISFPVERKRLQTKEGQKISKALVLNSSTMQKMGIVNLKKPVLEYPDVMDLVTTEFDRAGLPFKLRESTLLGKSLNLYQEYLFDREMETPDGNGMSPMAILKSSYVGSPLELFFGTYRFTCSNGAMVGETIEKVKVGSKVQSLLNTSLKDDISYSLDKFSVVSNLYKELDSESMNPYLELFLADIYVSTGIKKLLLKKLSEEGDIIVIKDKVQKNDFFMEPEELYEIREKVSAWVLYNMVTQLATHKPRSAQGRFGNYKQISKVFGV